MPTPDADEPSRGLLAGSYAVTVALAVVIGVYATFLVPAGPRIGTFLLSYGVGLAVVGNAGTALLGTRLTGTRLGALLPLYVWIVLTVFVFGQRNGQGSLVLPGTTRTYVLIVAGILSAGAVAARARPTRGLTALPTAPAGRPPRTPAGRSPTRR